MTQTVECLHCKVVMEEGLIVDASYTNFVRQKWMAGQPEQKLLGGLKVDRDQLIPVKTLRCPKCGYMESYANGVPSAIS